jgi:hypothetical protein
MYFQSSNEYPESVALFRLKSVSRCEYNYNGDSVGHDFNVVDATRAAISRAHTK